MDAEFITELMDAAVRQSFLVSCTVNNETVRNVYLAEPDDSGRAVVLFFCTDDADLMDCADYYDGVMLSDDDGDPFEYSSPSDLLDLLQCEADGFNLFAVCPDHGSVIACKVPEETLEAF